jgi:sterol desaturase/sphingolipid hydroxylase (fatty acid hydroxylase superfamily)
LSRQEIHVVYVVGLAVGYLLWTGLETIIHRLGHARRPAHISSEHRRHHVSPDYFTPLYQKLPAIAPIVLALGVGFGAWGGTALGVGVAAGLFGGWLHYEWLHQMIHRRAPRTRYGRWARRHHLHHHFTNPRVNNGVTTPLWDYVLRTHATSSQIVVPSKFAPLFPWLPDESDSSRVAEPYRDLYTFSKR